MSICFDQVGKSVRNALVEDVVVHRAKLLPEAGLNLPAELGGFGFGFFGSGARSFHRFLLSHGFLAIIHMWSPSTLSAVGPGSPHQVSIQNR